MRWHRIAAVLVIVVALAIVGIVALRYFGIEPARDLVVQRLEAITGREVAIEGDFDLAAALTPTLAAEGIVIANAGWASDEPMVEAERIEIELQLIPLLWQGNVLIDRLALSGAEVLLETGAEGRANWRFEAPAPEALEGESREFLLNEVAVEDSQLRWRDLDTEVTRALAVDRLAWKAPEVTSEVTVTGSGQLDGEPFELSGELGALADLLAAEGPYPIALDAALGEMNVQIEGELRLPEEAVELEIAATGEQFARLGDLLGTDLPELGAYEFRGWLTGSTEALALVDLTGAVGVEGAPELRITDGTITDVLAGEGVLVEVEAEGRELADLAAALAIEMAPFGPYTAAGTLEGSFESLALRGVEAAAGGEATRVALAGAIGEVLELSGLDLAATIEGTDLAALSPLVRFELPASEPYRIAGQVTGALDGPRIDDLEAEIGDSRLHGWLAVERREAEPPRIEGELIANRLDVDQLLALAGDEEAAEEAPAEVAPDRPGLFPERPLSVAWLDEIAGEIVLRADEVRLGQVDFTDASVALVLQEGRLGVQDLILQVAGGSVTGGAALEAREDGDLAEVTVSLNAQDIDVAQLVAGRAAAERITGEIDIDINLDATGRSLDELMASLEGSAALVGEEGRIKDAPLDLLVTDLDILRALPPFWRRDDNEVRVNCLITEMDIEAGVAQTEAMLDTQRMVLLGQGTVDLGEEQLDLVLRPKAKTPKLSTLAVPVDITGSLTEPDVRPRTGTAVRQAVRGVLGGLLIPLNQLSALFGKETVDACRQALQQAGQQRNPAPAASSSPG